MKSLPTKERLWTIFRYDRSTGELSWLRREDASARWNATYAGKKSGSFNAKGYRRVAIDKTTYLVHRLVWKMFHGNEPAIIDHIDRDPSNNKIENLRSADNSTNQFNTARHRDKRADLPKGVDLHGPSGLYRARISIRGVRRHLGWFGSSTLAAAAYQAAAIEQGQFACAEEISP